MDHRADRMKSLIIRTFFDCMEKEDFSQITIGKISEQALINRSTFYRYFSDKYELRDEVVDHIVQDFADHMEVDFLHMDVSDAEHARFRIVWLTFALRNVSWKFCGSNSCSVEMSLMK